MRTHLASPSSSARIARPASPLPLPAGSRIKPRLVWASCAGFACAAAATQAMLELASQGWSGLCDPQIGPTELSLSLFTFVVGFAVLFLASSAVAFGLLGLLRLKARRPRKATTWREVRVAFDEILTESGAFQMAPRNAG